MACNLQTAGGSLLRCSSPIENLVWGRRDHFDIFGYEGAPFDVFDEFRFDLVGEDFSDARVLLQCPTTRRSRRNVVDPGVVATQHTVLHLRPQIYAWGFAVGVIEFLERTDEFFLFAFAHAKIIMCRKLPFVARGSCAMTLLPFVADVTVRWCIF